MTNRYGFLKQDITLSYTNLVNSLPTDVFSMIQVDIYDDLNTAINSGTSIYTTTTITSGGLNTGIYNYIIPRDTIKIEGNYYDKVIFLLNNGDIVNTTNINDFYVKSQPEVIPGNALTIDYSDQDLFKNVDGEITFNDYSSDLLVYSDFDIDANASYAKINTTTTTTGTPVITSGGVFGNYIALNNASIKYNKSNWNNNYTEGTIDTRIRLGFDNGKTFQEFLGGPVTGSTLLSYDQKPAGALLYASYDSSVDANWGNGTLTGTNYNTCTYGPGGKFGNCLYLLGNKYLTYPATDNFSKNTGAISFWIRPLYTGSPINEQTFIDVSGVLQIKHLATGQINININGVFNQDFYDFTPQGDVWYHFELEYDLVNGASRLFVDGDQKGLNSNTGTMSGSLTTISIGGTTNNDFYLDEFLTYSVVQNLTNFTPSGVENLQVIPITDNYRFKLKVNGVYNNTGSDVVISITPTDTFQDICNKITNQIANAVASIVNFKIRITASNYLWEVSIEPPAGSNSLLDALGGIGAMTIPNGPLNDTIIMQYYDGSTNYNRIQIIHSTIGEIIIKMYDGAGNLAINSNQGIWSTLSNTWYNFVLCFNSNIAQVFINGVQFGDTINTNLSRTAITDFYIGTGANLYGYDEFKIYSSYKFFKNYTITSSALTKYPQSNPYILLNWGTGIKIPTDANIESTGSFLVVSYCGTQSYYYLAGQWILSDGTVNQANTFSEFNSNIKNFPFNAQLPFKVKVFFVSDGVTNCYLNRFYLNFKVEYVPDYSPIIKWVRTKLGEPKLPIELDNVQIEANIEEALAKWNYYRYHKEDVMVVKNLDGDNISGYEIPEGWDNFYDIIFSPRSPIAGIMYTSGWGQNIYLQYFYNTMSSEGGSFEGMQTDFYLLLSNLSDAQITFGLQPTWKVYNNRLYVYPDPTSFVNIGLIKAREASISEINNDIWLRKYVLALSKITLGEIRETIGTIPAGMENITLNGPALKTEGQAEVDRLELEFRAKMEPLFVYFI